MNEIKRNMNNASKWPKALRKREFYCGHRICDDLVKKSLN